eukprot:Gb_40936 [translate_table: standard]
MCPLLLNCGCRGELFDEIDQSGTAEVRWALAYYRKINGLRALAEGKQVHVQFIQLDAFPGNHFFWTYMRSVEDTSVGIPLHRSVSSYLSCKHNCASVVRVEQICLSASKMAFCNDIDLLHPPAEIEKQKHKFKRLVQSPNSFFMDVKRQGCLNIKIVFSHSQIVVVCGNCHTVICQPIGGFRHSIRVCRCHLAALRMQRATSEEPGGILGTVTEYMGLSESSHVRRFSFICQRSDVQQICSSYQFCVNRQDGVVLVSLAQTDKRCNDICRVLNIDDEALRHTLDIVLEWWACRCRRQFVVSSLSFVKRVTCRRTHYVRAPGLCGQQLTARGTVQLAQCPLKGPRANCTVPHAVICWLHSFLLRQRTLE